MIIKRTSWLVGSLLVVLYAAAAHADSIGPGCGSCNGGIYTLTYSGSPISSTATTKTYRITLTINTTDRLFDRHGRCGRCCCDQGEFVGCFHVAVFCTNFRVGNHRWRH